MTEATTVTMFVLPKMEPQLNGKFFWFQKCKNEN